MLAKDYEDCSPTYVRKICTSKLSRKYLLLYFKQNLWAHCILITLVMYTYMHTHLYAVFEAFSSFISFISSVLHITSHKKNRSILSYTMILRGFFFLVLYNYLDFSKI